MLFRRLLERNPRTAWLTTAEGYAVSIAAHVVLLGSTLVATTEPLGQREIADTFTPVEYFIPKDRFLGVKRVQERLSFVSVEGARKNLDAERRNLQSLLTQIQNTRTSLDTSLSRAELLVDRLREKLERDIDKALLKDDEADQ